MGLSERSGSPFFFPRNEGLQGCDLILTLFLEFSTYIWTCMSKL